MFSNGAESRSRPRPVTRRDLFRRRDSSADRTMPDSPASRSQPGRSASGSLINASRPLMGSYFEVRVGSAVPGAIDLATRALDEIEAIEACLTVYDPESETCRVNASAHLGPVEVSTHLFDTTRLGLAAARQTAGAYDPTSGALSEAWGFTRGPKHVPTADQRADALLRTGHRLVKLDDDRRSIQFLRPGIALNFGGIGKGYAVDRAVDRVRGHWWPTGTLIHGGRSSLFALGSPPDDFGGRWPIALRDPTSAEPRSLGTIHLRNRGMATSGSDYQRFQVGDRTYGHIIDPRTGEPPQHGPAGVTVLAPSAAEADALSTAFYLLGVEGSRPILDRRPDVAALFVDQPRPGQAPLLTAFHLTDADFTVGISSTSAAYLS